MTTIAARFSTLEIAADSMCSSDDSFYLVEKLRKGKNSIYGACGDWDKILKFYAALERGEDLDSDCDITVMELRNDGLWIYEGTIIPAKIKNDFWAIGTGANYAIAAMHLGKTPLEAVKIACKYDTSSTEPIDYMTLGVPGGKKTRKR
jgi:ATP-dependent protease HslVU (ClpYQ) peptidase subunit